MIIIAHGGAGQSKPAKKALEKLGDALKRGYEVLNSDGGALEAVIETIIVLEDSGLFNAGTGGNLQLDGKRRLDASVMEGRGLESGSVIGLEGIKNPIKAARLVMDSPHRILTNKGAKRLALASRLPKLAEPDERQLWELEKARSSDEEIVRLYERYFSTVGAVALDNKGDIASGSSTGGVALMFPGRVGDTPIIGAGVYAENSYGAVSCTGRGEDIIRLALAKEICMNMKDLSPEKASESSLKRLLMIGGRAGVLALDSSGRFAITHTTEYMASGYMDKKGIVVKGGFKKVFD